MKKVLPVFLLIFISSLLILKESQLKRPSDPLPEGCIFCHAGVKDPDPSHPTSAFGCYTCHLGNAYSLDKKRAHFAMVRNPGDLRVVDRTCGRTRCHSDIVTRVQNSIMATNRGILTKIQYDWLNIHRATTEVKDLMGENRHDNIAIEHYRKMCGGCHLWKERGDRPGEVGLRGGGCSDCHVLNEERKKGVETEEFDHPRMTTRIPSENCVKCHNRSARIGLSYFGRFESAGYGTPYHGRSLSNRKLSGKRFFLDLPADVHFSKVGLECIDCHTAIGLMGDSKQYSEMAEQVDITCEACHVPEFSKVSKSDLLANRLVFLNKKVPGIQGGHIGSSKKGTPIYNLQKRGDRVLFFRKLDGRPVEMNITTPKKPYHKLPGHARLSCQACHSSWAPQCYGCHITYRKSERQRDWISGNETPGRWKEARSYLRFSRPALGVKDSSVISPISPCQVFVSIFDDVGGHQEQSAFQVLSMSAFDPHTTSKKSRECLECHGDPKVLGMGEGLLNQKGGKLVFRPTFDSNASGLGLSFPLDGFINLEGEMLQGSSPEKARAFNKIEIHDILSVNTCLGCHNRYDDDIYQDFCAAKTRFQSESGLPCRE